MAATKIYTPISDFYASPANKLLVKPDDFIKETTAGLEYQGKLWAYPVLAAPYMLGYRSNLLANAEERKAFKVKYAYDLVVPDTYKRLLEVYQYYIRKNVEIVG